MALVYWVLLYSSLAAAVLCGGRCYYCSHQTRGGQSAGQSACRDPLEPGSVDTVECAGNCAKTTYDYGAEFSFVYRSCQPDCRPGYSHASWEEYWGYTYCCAGDRCNTAIRVVAAVSRWSAVSGVVVSVLARRLL